MRQEKDMGFKTGFGIKGLFHAQLFDENGNVKEERIVHNTVTELGDAHVADAMSDQAEGALGYMAVGTGTGQGAADVGLATSLDRNALTSTTQGAGAADNDVIFVGTWAAGDGTGAITEAGILLGDNNTSMNYYADFAVVNKAAGDSLVITWTVTYGSS
jgi:hypothetical protein